MERQTVTAEEELAEGGKGAPLPGSCLGASVVYIAALLTLPPRQTRTHLHSPFLLLHF